MAKQIAIRFFGRNQGESYTNEFLTFPDLEEAEAYVLGWLERKCGVECVSEEERLRRSALGDHLVITRIPLESPADLANYRGIYFFEEEGSIALDIDVIWDEQSAQRFRNAAFKEYRLDEIFTDEADSMMGMLDQVVSFYRGESVEITPILEKIREMVMKDGVSEF